MKNIQPLAPPPNSKHEHLTHPKYRADIDGLRAIAVLSVVCFHAFPYWLKGGFIGVDIFFVISGFLISTIIFENLDKGTFSFSEFYARRINRIFPALILVLIACFAFGWFALLADEYKQLGKHIAAGAGFVSNFVFWNESGYFDNAAETKPLLHLWTLGIEEQFYIVWPLLLWSAWKRKFNLLSLTLVITTLSFALNIKGLHSDAVATFYSPQTRFWELLIGSTLAYVTLYKPNLLATKKQKLNTYLNAIIYAPSSQSNDNTLRNIQAIIGATLIGIGLLLITKERHFPGTWALLPTLGAVLIISAGSQAWLNRVILSNRILVWFGLISFPLYLWHWPLLSFARIVESETPARNIRIAAVVISIALAWLTYKFIEKPIRFGKFGNTKTIVLAVLMIAIGSIGYISYKHNGFSSIRTSISGINYSGNDIVKLTENDPISHSNCMKMYNLSRNIRYCSVSTSDKPNIALIGDSHSAALYNGLSEQLLSEGKGLVNLGGRLFLDVATYPLGSNAEIEIYKGGIRATEFVAQEKSINTVILVSRGPFYLYDNWIFTLISNPSITDRKQVFEIGMRKTLDALNHKEQVIFVMDNPELNFDPRLCFVRPLRKNTSSTGDCSISRVAYNLRHKEYRELVRRVLKDYPKVRLFDSSAYLCDTLKCYGKIGGKILYGDSDHLSLNGAIFISKELSKVLNGAESKLLIQ